MYLSAKPKVWELYPREKKEQKSVDSRPSLVFSANSPPSGGFPHTSVMGLFFAHVSVSRRCFSKVMYKSHVRCIVAFGLTLLIRLLVRRVALRHKVVKVGFWKRPGSYQRIIGYRTLVEKICFSFIGDC